MNITEKPLAQDSLDSIVQCADEAARALKLGDDWEQLPAAKIVAAIDQCIFGLQNGKPFEFSDADDATLTLGSLWGQQLIRQLGWQWSSVVFHDHDDAFAVGVFSKDRALAIYPFHFLFGCLENNAEVTVELAFNMLVDGTRIPKLPANGFENVMDNVHHVVPRTSP